MTLEIRWSRQSFPLPRLEITEHPISNPPIKGPSTVAYITKVKRQVAESISSHATEARLMHEGWGEPQRLYPGYPCSTFEKSSSGQVAALPRQCALSFWMLFLKASPTVEWKPKSQLSFRQAKGIKDAHASFQVCQRAAAL